MYIINNGNVLKRGGKYKMLHIKYYYYKNKMSDV